MVLDALNALAGLQSTGETEIPTGNFPSTRYHPLFKFSRTEDNVYFISWILQSLKRHAHLMTDEELEIAASILQKGEASLIHYRSRYGGAAYNFYRADSWFPGGIFLKRFKTFQPTDDADDTAIAYRGLYDAHGFVPEFKALLEDQANGMHGKFLKRGPQRFRANKLFNTWIGSRQLFVDLDLVVVCNILLFNACYAIEKSALVRSNIQFVLEAVQSGLYLKEKWSLCAWYPFDEVILYNLADVLSTGYYPELEVIREELVKELKDLFLTSDRSAVSKMLIENALMKCGVDSYSSPDYSLKSFLKKSQDFTFGVIPLLHPFEGRFMQRTAAYDLFRLHYRCDAHVLSILIEHELLSRSKRN